jgi:tetratricopeptide (TPR) repeat protein
MSLCDNIQRARPASATPAKSYLRHADPKIHKDATLRGHQMDNSVLLLIVLVVATGMFIYFSRQKPQRIAKDTEQERFSTAASHFADLAGKGIQIKLIAGEPPNISLRNGEHVLCVLPNTTLLEPRAVRTWRSTYGGPTVRVARGLSFRFGQSRGVSESHDELRAIDIGTFLLTNERLLFIGSQRTNSIALQKVVEVEGLRDGLVVHREGKEKIESYQLSRAMQMSYQYDGQALAVPVDGRLVKAVIDEAVAVRQDAMSRSVVAVSDGDILLAQGNLGEALKSYRESLAIRERLIKADPDRTDCQHPLAVSYQRIGDVLLAQSNRPEALKSYRDSFGIMDRLAKVDPNSTKAQRELSVSYLKIGDALNAQGSFGEALQSYRNCLTIAERLARADPGNTAAQRDLLVSYDSLGDALKAQGNLGEALQSYREGLASAERLVKADPSISQKELRYAVGKFGALAFKFLQARNFSQALDAANLPISVAPDLILPYATRAHALMFLSRVDEARAIYLKYRGRQKVQGVKSWEAVVLEDFAELRKAGLTHPLMDEIAQAFPAKV